MSQLAVETPAAAERWLWSRSPAASARRTMRNPWRWARTSGRPLADEVALPLVEAWSGVPAERLAASVGGKIPRACSDHAAEAGGTPHPPGILARLVAGSDALADQGRFRYGPMVFVNLRLRGRGLLPEVVTWTPEPALPFFRLTEATLAMPQLAPPHKTLITADIGCELDDATWSLPDDALGERCIEGLRTMVRDTASRYLDCRVLRTPVAYPVFLREYEEARIRWQRSSGVRGLVSVGRNGEFDHLLMEDVHWRTLGRTRRRAARANESRAAAGRALSQSNAVLSWVCPSGFPGPRGRSLGRRRRRFGSAS